MEKLTFVTEDQESVDFYIIEETRVNGINYLLVTESEDAEDTEAVYEFVESEEELDAVSRIFAELLEDMDLE